MHTFSLTEFSFATYKHCKSYTDISFSYHLCFLLHANSFRKRKCMFPSPFPLFIFIISPSNAPFNFIFWNRKLANNAHLRTFFPHNFYFATLPTLPKLQTYFSSFSPLILPSEKENVCPPLCSLFILIISPSIAHINFIFQNKKINKQCRPYAHLFFKQNFRLQLTNIAKVTLTHHSLITSVSFFTRQLIKKKENVCPPLHSLFSL